MLNLARRYSGTLVANINLNEALAEADADVRTLSIFHGIVDQISYGASDFVGPTRANYSFGDLSFDREPEFARVIADAGHQRRGVDLS